MIQGKLIAQDFVGKTLTFKVKDLRKMLDMKKMILLEDHELLGFFEAMECEIKGKLINTQKAKKVREIALKRVLKNQWNKIS